MAIDSTSRAHLSDLSDAVTAWHDPHAEDMAYWSLAAAYGMVALVALVQLARIHRRVPEYGWTTQKVFHVLNFACAVCRCSVFACRRVLEANAIGGGVDDAKIKIAWLITREFLLNVPAALFFTTYSLLVLFWAEIYYNAKSLEVGNLRNSFIGANSVVYLCLLVLCVVLGVKPEFYEIVSVVSAFTLALASLLLTAGFIKYGGRLWQMLRKFPVSAKGRRKKIMEIGVVTTVCAACFLCRSVAMVADAVFLEKGNGIQIDSTRTPLVDIVYYATTELFPTVLVLFVLRKLPPKAPSREVYEGSENV